MITIIVLLILVGVTLSTLSGQDGILNKAATATDRTNKEAIKEKIQFEIFDCYDNNNDFNMDKLQGKLSKKYENVKYYANGSIILPIDKYFAMIKEESGNIVIEVEEKEEKFNLAEEKVIDVVLGNLEDFKNFKESVNNGDDYTGKIIKQTADIDMGGAKNGGWTPIGTQEHPFKGTFDGGKHKIENLYIGSDEQASAIGLFGYNEGTIKNVGIETLEIATTQINKCVHLGAICGDNSGRIERCYNNANFSCNWKWNETEKTRSLIGGIVGCVSGSGCIYECYNSGIITVTADSYWGAAVGGILGYGDNGCDISGCYNSGNIENISGAANPMAGGIAGEVNGSMNSCYNTGEITTKQTDFNKSWPAVGGVTGQLKCEIQNCYNIGKTKLETSREENLRHGSIAGTIFGAGSVENCHCWCGEGIKDVDNVQVEQSKINVQRYSNKEELKVIADKLGEAFTADTKRN